MSYTPYREIEQAISNREDIDGNSVTAYTDASGIYHIVSYSTEMARIGEGGEVEYFNSAHYSSTTSRLQNIIKKVFAIN